MTSTVYLLDKKENPDAVCYACGKPAYALAGPDHPPFDGNANYCCGDCILPSYTIWDPKTQRIVERTAEGEKNG